MRQRLTLVLVRAAIAVLLAGLSTFLLTPAAADAAFLTYDTPSYSHDVDVDDARPIATVWEVSSGHGASAATGLTAGSGGRGHVYDPSAFFVAPNTTRVYSSGPGALQRGAISLDDAARVAAENGIDMRAITLRYESGAPSNLYGFTSMDGAGNIVRAPDGRYIVTLTDAGLSSPGSALNTIAHELNHIREISRTPGFHIPEEAGATLAGDLAELFMRGG